MSEETNIALLQKIVSDQRQILKDVHGVEDVTTIPQLWTLCKFMAILGRSRYTNS